MADPRIFQIATLASLLVYGMNRLGFDITADRVVLLLGTALATQVACELIERWFTAGQDRVRLKPDTTGDPQRQPAPESGTRPQSAVNSGSGRLQPAHFNFKSALISGLSLCLLLRTNRPELALAAAVIAIAGKFVFRIRGKHIFNPTNGGIVAMMLLSNDVW